MSSPDRTRTTRRTRGAMAALLLASISWSVDRAGDPLHSISREDLNLAGNVREVLVEEAGVTTTRESELSEGSRHPAERIVFDADGLPIVAPRTAN